MGVRGVRGATTVSENLPGPILSATRELLLAILEANPSMQSADLASAFFSLSPDLNAAYPAAAARELGWHQVPLMCFQEIPVPGGLEACIRLLLHWNTDLSQAEIQHVYLHRAEGLRPDLRRNELDRENHHRNSQTRRKK